jgi:hypothetical protein
MVNVITRSEFYTYRALASMNAKAIASRYAELDARYVCFDETPLTSTPQVPVRVYRSCSVKRPIPCKLRKPHVSRDPLRAIVGFLNIINTDNYSKILSKLRLIIDRSNVESMTKAIMEKCYVATIFVDVYIKLLQDLNNLYPIQTTIESLVSQATDRFEFVINEAECDDAYDLFCKKQKHKLMTMGMNTTIIKLCKASLIPKELLVEYFSFFEKLIKTKTDEYNLDLGINIVIALLKGYKDLAENPALLAATIQCKVPRIKFLIQELGQVY